MTEKKSRYTGYTKEKGQANIEYSKRALKRVPLDLRKEKYEQVKAYADLQGETVNGFIKIAIEERIDKLSGDKTVPDPAEDETGPAPGAGIKDHESP